jgi:outer membrane protein assembly factor BamE (lipoprotein component of BamABCDE complex)
MTHELRSRHARLAGVASVAITLLVALAACVTQDMSTGRMVPRGQQGMQFSDVESAAERLKEGMTKQEVLYLLGSPAERDESGNVWIYLPERYAILIPARALRVEFKDTILVDHGYRPIVLGARL